MTSYNEYEENPTIDRDNFQGQVFLNVQALIEQGSFNPTKAQENFIIQMCQMPFEEFPNMYPYSIVKCILNGEGEIIKWVNWGKCHYAKGEIHLTPQNHTSPLLHNDNEWEILLPLCCLLEWDKLSPLHNWGESH